MMTVKNGLWTKESHTIVGKIGEEKEQKVETQLAMRNLEFFFYKRDIRRYRYDFINNGKIEQGVKERA